MKENNQTANNPNLYSNKGLTFFKVQNINRSEQKVINQKRVPSGEREGKQQFCKLVY